MVTISLCVDTSTGGWVNRFDDFSNPNSGWPVLNDAAKTYAYVNGEYQMLRKYTYDNGFSAPDLVLPANYRVEVDAHQPSTAKDSHGLVFGLNSSGDTWESYQFYELLVYPPSQVFLLEKKDEHDTWITVVDWTYSGYINVNSPNRLRVDRDGTRIELYINDTLVYTVYDGSFTGAGRGAGLRVYSGEFAPVDTRFDNFSATCLP